MSAARSPNSTPPATTLCPDPTPENTAGRSDRTIAYRAQITGLPPGLEIVFNGERYDGCRDSDGHLLEAKGEGYANMMFDRDNWRDWFTGLDSLQEQMEEHSGKAADRIVEYYFAEKDVADYFRQYAQQMGLENIIVYYVLAERRK